MAEKTKRPSDIEILAATVKSVASGVKILKRQVKELQDMNRQRREAGDARWKREHGVGK